MGSAGWGWGYKRGRRQGQDLTGEQAAPVARRAVEPNRQSSVCKGGQWRWPARPPRFVAAQLPPPPPAARPWSGLALSAPLPSATKGGGVRRHHKCGLGQTGGDTTRPSAQYVAVRESWGMEQLVESSPGIARNLIATQRQLATRARMTAGWSDANS